MRRVLAILLSVFMVIGTMPVFAEEPGHEPVYLYLDFEGSLPDGVISKDLTYLDGISGKGGYFNGSLSYVKLPDNITKGVTDFTVATWIRFEYTDLSYQRIFDFGSGTTNYMFLGMASTTSALRFESLVPGGSKSNITSNTKLSNGEWTHVAVTKSGNTVTLYINGAVEGTLESTFTPDSLGETTQNYLGKSQFEADKYLSATLDNFLFAGRALSAQEIQQQATKPAVTESDLYHYVEIYHQDNIKDNLYLPDKVNGATVTWTSSDESVVSTKSIQNGDYIMPPGVIKRGSVDKKVTLTANISLNGMSVQKTFNLTVKALPIQEEKTGYIYAYFRGFVNGSPDEVLSIHLAASKDGLHWVDLNGNYPVLVSNVGTRAVRDPYIVRSPYGDKFYLMATDLNTEESSSSDWTKWSMQGSKYIIVWESDDLVNWSEPRMVKFADNRMGCAWAPEAIYDEATGEYWVYAAGKYLTKTPVQDTVFLARTRDFRTFTAPEVFVGGDGTPRIDTTMIKAHDGKIYRFTKKANSYVDMQVADSLYWTFRDVPGYSTINGEGPAIFKMNGESTTYCLLIDDYSKFVPYITNDIASGKFTKAEAKMPTGSKHGVVLPVTQKEYDAVIAKWGELPASEKGAPPIVEYDFENDDAEIFGNAKYVQDPEKNSRALKLDGTNSYLAFPDNIFDRRDTFTLTMDVKVEGDNTDTAVFAVGRDNLHDFWLNATKNGYASRLTLEKTINDVANISGLDSQIGTWVNISLVVEPTRVSVYRNGIKLAENANMTRTIYHLGEKDLLAYLGKSFNNTYFAGSLDNVKLYDRALTEEEIKASLPVKTDEESVKEDKLLLIFSENLDALMGNLTLPSACANGSTITWVSSNPSVISNNGVITRGTDDMTAVLTATISKGGYTETKHFVVTVLAAGEQWISDEAAGSPWPYHTFSEQSGEFFFEYDITPHQITDGVVGICGTNVSPTTWSSPSMAIRIQPNGYMDVRNGSDYSSTTAVPYEINKTYHISVKANISTKTYSVYVTTPDGTTYQLANNFTFRSDAPYITSVNKVITVGGAGISGGLFTVSNFRITEGKPKITSVKVTDSKAACTIISREEKNYDLYIAEYDANNILLSVKKIDVPFKFGVSANFEAAISNGAKVKFMLWKDGMNEPVTVSKTRNVIQLK